jgi:redox-sensitive bicupin YhaK (pirin superfamily)
VGGAAADAEEVEPGFAHHDVEDLPTYEAGGLWARLVVGTAFGAEARVKTSSPMFYVHWEMQPGAIGGVEVRHPERAAYVATGVVEIDGRELRAGQLAVFGPEGTPVVKAVTQATVMLLGGEPVGPRFVEWNFVSSRKDRIEEAKADWRAGRFALPPEDRAEWIPLPEPTPPANPMS